MSDTQFDKEISLHETIEDDDLEATALKWDNDEIYELLLSKEIFLGPHGQMDEVLDGKGRRKKEMLRSIHNKNIDKAILDKN